MDFKITPDLIDLVNSPIEPLKYEDTLFKSMADDIKSPIEKQLSAIETIADNAKSQAESSSIIADSAKLQADIAFKKSKKADVKGWIAIILSVLALIFEFAINSDAIMNFFKSLF